MTKKSSITVYGTSWCGSCIQSQMILEEKNIFYNYINIDESPEAALVVTKINGGMRSVPTIVMPDGKVLVEPTRIELLNALSAFSS